MSVVIAAPPAKLQTQAPPASTSASAASTESAGSSDTLPSGIDFASLLLGQLAARKDLQPVSPADTTTLADDSSATTEAVPQDPALLLAALGMMPLEPAPKAIEAPRTDKTENTLLAGIGGKDAAASLSKIQEDILASDQKGKSGESSSGFALPAALGVDDKPAKLAVADFTLPKAEALPASAQTDQVPGNGAAGVSPHTSATAMRNDGALKLETPVHDRAWTGDFSQKIVWMASNDKQVAQLTLNPPEMGPIEISLNLTKDGASALFVSHNAEVREAIETALPRLREMLAGAGIELGQANVSAESFRQQAGNDEARQGAPRWMADNAILGGDSAHGVSGQTIIAQRGNGLVDIFA